MSSQLNFNAYINKLILYLHKFYPNNLIIPCSDTKHPLYKHKDGQYNWDLIMSKTNPVQFFPNQSIGLLVKDILCMDIDDHQYVDKYEQMFPILNEVVSQKTKKGKHYFFLRTPDCDLYNIYDCARALKIDGEKIPIDIKTICSTNTAGVVIIDPSPNKKWIINILDKPLIPLPEDLLNHIKNNWHNNAPVKESTPILKPMLTRTTSTDSLKSITSEVTQVETYNSTAISTVDESFVINLLDLLSPQRYNDYTDWITVGMILKNISNNYLLHWIKWSKKSKSFNHGECQLKWNTFDKNGTLGIATLRMFAKQDNFTKYTLLLQNENIIKEIQKANTTDYDIAYVVWLMFKDICVCVDSKDKKWYYYNGFFWKFDKGGDFIYSSFSKECVSKYLQAISSIANKAATEEDTNIRDRLTDSMDVLKKCIIKLKSTNNKKNLLCECANLFLDVEFESKLDRKTHFYAFNNKILDTNTNQWIEPHPNQYISMTTGYDWVPTSPEKIKWLWDNLINKIWSPKYYDERDYYLTYLSTALIALTLEYFLIANGKGANGKSGVNSLALSTFGNYGYDASVESIMSYIKEGPNPAVAGLHKKRLVIYSEVPKSKKLCTSSIKKLTGGKSVNARDLYSSNTNTLLHLTAICECNEKPLLDDTDGGTIRRIVDILFRSKFVPEDQIKDYDGIEGVYCENKFLKTEEFQNEYKLAFFEILRDYYVKYRLNNSQFVVPDEIKKRSQKYLQSCDDFYGWLEDTYEKTDNNDDFISVKQVFDDYKLSSLYRNLSKAKIRETNSKNFKDTIKNNALLKFNYKERHQYYEDGKRVNTTNVLLGFKEIIKEKYEDSDNDC